MESSMLDLVRTELTICKQNWCKRALFQDIYVQITDCKNTMEDGKDLNDGLGVVVHDDQGKGGNTVLWRPWWKRSTWDEDYGGRELNEVCVVGYFEDIHSVFGHTVEQDTDGVELPGTCCSRCAYDVQAVSDYSRFTQPC